MDKVNLYASQVEWLRGLARVLLDQDHIPQTTFDTLQDIADQIEVATLSSKQQLKRYRMKVERLSHRLGLMTMANDQNEVAPVEDQAGEWVRWSDVQMLHVETPAPLASKKYVALAEEFLRGETTMPRGNQFSVGEFAAWLDDRSRDETPALQCDAAEEYVIKAFLALGHRATDAQIAEVAAKVRAVLPPKTSGEPL